jgi:uncharacterized protein YndB with AHSA1/START domain
MVPERIEREILIDAPLEVVWAVVTEPEQISGWFSDSAELELRPGGKATLHWDGHGSFQARVERVEPPHFFSLRWTTEPEQDLTDANSTLIEFTLSAEGDSTRLRMVESGFSDLAGPEDEKQGHFDAHQRGWDVELGDLEEYVGQRREGTP